jgi:hypothetical protein
MVHPGLDGLTSVFFCLVKGQGGFCKLDELKTFSMSDSVSAQEQLMVNVLQVPAYSVDFTPPRLLTYAPSLPWYGWYGQTQPAIVNVNPYPMAMNYPMVSNVRTSTWNCDFWELGSDRKCVLGLKIEIVRTLMAMTPGLNYVGGPEVVIIENNGYGGMMGGGYYNNGMPLVIEQQPIYGGFGVNADVGGGGEIMGRFKK